ncbi:MAG: right-handed parallel beta-helix repeat-containing protein [Pseudodesulfovibrio sp.]|uniref:right-handed parallel beta-helix repeat-containing protein n=1 Tax=Pseudodesulfovibrio sp. TaxID=2035812 RepID=UPI003D0F2507
MATNEILPFGHQGTEVNGDILSLAEYADEPQRLIGNQAGIARRELVNTVLRQTSHMAAGLAQFIANRHPDGIVDDADLDKVEAAILSAILKVARKPLTEDITVTVGTGGDYATVTEAVAHLASMYYVLGDGFTATISLLSGFVWAEQLSLAYTDLQWITITSVDAVVTVQRSAIPDGEAVIRGEYCSLPQLLALLQMDTSGVAGSRIGIHLLGASISVDGGFRNADYRNMVVQGNSSVSATYCDFSGSGDIGVYVQDSRATLDGSDFSNCVGYGMLAMRASFVSVAAAGADNCGVGFKANMGAFVTAWTAHALNCTTYGFHAADMGHMQVTSADASGAGTYGYCVTSGAMLNRRASTGTYSQALSTPTTHGIIF